MPPKRPYSQLRVTLPSFVITALRELVREANAKRPKGKPWTVSYLLETWFCEAISDKDMRAIAERTPGFKEEVEAWTKETAARLKRANVQK